MSSTYIKDEWNSKDFILLGGIKEDIRISANNNVLLVNPLWVNNLDESVKKYGFSISTPNQLVSCIDILELNTQTYHRSSLSDKTELITLTSARNIGTSINQSAIITNYRGYLKQGNEIYKYALFFHYLTFITQNPEFKNVDIWTGAPSSSGSRKNGIYEIVEYSRYLFKKQEKPILLRHKPAQKSTEIDSSTRKRLDSSRHFQTVHLNEKYKRDLKNATVVVLDDYVTNGHTFEAVRILLEKAGVKKLYLISIGTYKNNYQKQVAELEGDIFSEDYNFNIVKKESLSLKYNEESLDVIDKIYSIIYS